MVVQEGSSQRHRHIIQYLKLSEIGLLEFVSRQLVASSCDLFRATHPEENNVSIHLVMYSRVVRW